MTESNGIHETVSTLLGKTKEPVYLLRSSSELVKIFVEIATQQESSPIHVLATEDVLKDIRSQFPIATRAAELVTRNRLTLTPTIPDGWGTAVVAGDTGYEFAHIEDHHLIFETDKIPDGLSDTCEGYRDSSDRFSLRTPPWSTATDTLEVEFGIDVREDFATAIETLASLEKPAIDEVTAVLLVGAHNDVLLYDLSHWSEDIGFYSKASFSRAKRDLEDEGILYSEKVPTEVGRPRLRLTLADEYDSLPVSELLREINTRRSD